MTATTSIYCTTCFSRLFSSLRAVQIEILRSISVRPEIRFHYCTIQALTIHPANFTQSTNSDRVNKSSSKFMYLNQQQRFIETVLDITDKLIGMALDPRLMPGVAAEMRTVGSFASTPSLRSREGSVTPIGRMDAPGGKRQGRC